MSTKSTKGGEVVIRSRYIQSDIIAYLQDGKLHTMQELCDELAISRSTCYRHIIDLSIHYNIQTFVGGRNSSGVRLIPEQKVSVKNLNVDDLQLIIRKLSLLQNDNPRIKDFIHNLTTQKEIKENDEIEREIL